MSYLVSFYDNIKGIYDYVLSESKSAYKNLENYKKYVDCKVYNSKGFLLDGAVRLDINKVEKCKVLNDGECREWLADLYAQLKGKSKKIVIGNVYTYKTNLQYDNYKKYYNDTKFKVTGVFDKSSSLYDKRVKAYEGYFIDSPDKEVIVVFSINLT